MYRNSHLGFWLRELQHCNSEGYYEAYRSQILGSDPVEWTGMRTEDLALWLIERREICLDEIHSISYSLGIDIVAIVSDLKHLDNFIDTSVLTPKSMELLIKQVKRHWMNGES